MADNGFFSFHTMVSTSIIKGIYACGLVLVSLTGCLQLVVAGLLLSGREFDEPAMVALLGGDPVIKIVSGLLVLVVGNLFWRLFCEGWILLFSMHELLSEIANWQRSRDV